MPTAPTVSVNDPVLYVPHFDHHRDKDMQNDYVFEFVHVQDGPVRDGKFTATQGQRALQVARLGEFVRREPGTHILHTGGGHAIKATRPLKAWAARVLAVKSDDKLDLEIEHPHGHKLHYFDVPHSADGLAGTLHTWHLPA